MMLPPPAILTADDIGVRTPFGHLASQGGLAGQPSSGPIGVTRTLLGFRIPFLPDFLEDHTLLSDAAGERLAEVLARQVSLVQNLWKWQGAGFSLRFYYDSDQRVIQLSLLARILNERAGGDVAHRLAQDLHRLFDAHGLAIEPVADVETLQYLCYPIERPFVAEVRQYEASVLLQWLDREAYTVYHFVRPQGTLLELCAAMMRLGTPCMVNIHLEPTRLTQVEVEEMSRIAAITATAAEEQRRMYSESSSGRFSDPQAAQVAQQYRGLARRLVQPFVLAVQVAGTDEFGVMSVANLLGSACTLGAGQGNEPEAARAVFEVRYPRSEQEQAHAERALGELMLATWGVSELAEGRPLHRLSYLADAQGAAAAFRFPVAVRGGIPGIEVRQAAPDFYHGRKLAEGAHEIHLGELQRGGSVSVRVQEMARHGLVVGLPGSGKTNTCLYILDQLHRQQVPFLVVEPAKTEYRGLIRRPEYKDLRVFTAGDETTSPFRINPFELIPGVRVEVHLEALNTAINAVMPQFGILPSIIEESLEAIYNRRGWSLVDRAGHAEERLFPTMADFYREAIRVTEQRGYQGEFQGNILAAVKGRIGSLLRGSKGKMFNCQRSVSPEILFGRPVILELDSLNDDTKALTMLFLMILLREYRQTTVRQESEELGGSTGQRLRHLLLIEEAHRVLENVATSHNAEVAADTRARSVRSLVDMLVEMRAYGQGILIAEQSPEKLASDAIRNTNLKIAHMLPGREDRSAIASSMVMDEEQERFVGKLRVGQAAVFQTGLEKASFMQVPPHKSGIQHDDFLSDAAIRVHMEQAALAREARPLPFDGCRFCGEQCRYRDAIEPVTRDRALVGRFHTALSRFDSAPEPEHWKSHWCEVAQVCRDAAAEAGHDTVVDAAYCFLAHEIDFRFTPQMRRSFVQAIADLGQETTGGAGT